MIASLANQKFKQSIKLIELTKQLEREPCDSLSFTHRIRDDAIAGSSYVKPEVVISKEGFGGISGDINNLYISPTRGEVYIYSIRLQNPAMSMENNAEIYSGWDHSVVGNADYRKYQRIEHNIPATGTVRDRTSLPEGKYFVTYYIYYQTVIGTLYEEGEYRVFYDIEIVSTDYIVKNSKKIPSITDVINRILDVGLPRPIYKSPKYRLDPGFANKFKDVPAPEFFFPRMTLFEALLEVGKKIHGIPRLVYNEDTQEADTITYDLLGLDETYSIPSTASVIGYKNIQSADDYCGGLDSYAENHINTVDPNAGTVTDPFDGGYKTLRCESGVKIVNNTAVFECDRPIYRAVKFEMAYTDAQQGEVIGDLTPYLYEQAEYAGLFTSNAVSYPDSVAFALVWRQGDRFIRGFNTGSSATLNIIEQFLEPSIVNIVRREDKGISNDELYSNLAFRLTYIPMDNIRLRQYKPYETHPNDNLLYNQQNANTVEASYYGESLKGKIARMGNDIEVYTIRFRSPQDLPKLGVILTDTDGTEQGYVFKVTTRRARDYTVADVYVTQDFNRLSEYFALESNFRLFEVSERQSIDRQVTVPRMIKVSLGTPISLSEPRLADPNGSATSAYPIAAGRFMRTFTQELSSDDAISRPTVAVVRLLNEEAKQIGDRFFALPVNSTACGNSLAFSFGFADSYSAGYRSTAAGYVDENEVSWKQRRNSPYGDLFGSFYAMEFGISDSIWSSIISRYTPKYSDQSEAGGFCDSLPTLESPTRYEATIVKSFFSTRTQLLDAVVDTRGIRVIDKNSSERISVVVQFHGQATDKRIVFGTAMWNNNLLIRDEPVKTLDDDGNPTTTNRPAPRVYGLLSGRLNMLRNSIDLSSDKVIDFGALQTVSVTAGLGTIEEMVLPNNPGIKAWCIADSTNGEIYIGVNEAVAPGGATSPIYFNFDTEA